MAKARGKAGKPGLTERERLRLRLARDLKEYLAKGGSITKVPIGVGAENKARHWRTSRTVVEEAE